MLILTLKPVVLLLQFVSNEVRVRRKTAERKLGGVISRVLDVNRLPQVFLVLQKSPAVKVTHFKGCMGEAALNGKSVGLWNYVEREGTCHGCFGRYFAWLSVLEQI